MPQFSMTAQNSIGFTIENGRDKRVLQYRVLGVEGEQPFCIASDRLSVPFSVDTLAIGREIALFDCGQVLVQGLVPLWRQGQHMVPWLPYVSVRCGAHVPQRIRRRKA
jgi:hypothetical protein